VAEDNDAYVNEEVEAIREEGQYQDASTLWERDNQVELEDGTLIWL
jgi:hypothetical protein